MRSKSVWEMSEGHYGTALARGGGGDGNEEHGSKDPHACSGVISYSVSLVLERIHITSFSIKSAPIKGSNKCSSTAARTLLLLRRSNTQGSCVPQCMLQLKFSHYSAKLWPNSLAQSWYLILNSNQVRLTSKVNELQEERRYVHKAALKARSIAATSTAVIRHLRQGMQSHGRSTTRQGSAPCGPIFTAFTTH
jgi:hypothetical protein